MLRVQLGQRAASITLVGALRYGIREVRLRLPGAGSLSYSLAIVKILLHRHRPPWLPLLASDYTMPVAEGAARRAPRLRSGWRQGYTTLLRRVDKSARNWRI